MRVFIYLPDLRASAFPKIPAVPSISGQGMRYRRLDETRLSHDMSRDLQQRHGKGVAMEFAQILAA